MTSESDKNDIDKKMGFSSFGQKKAKTFEFQSIFDEAKRTARERSQANLIKNSSSENQELLLNFQTPDIEPEDDIVGPELPEGFLLPEIVNKAHNDSPQPCAINYKENSDSSEESEEYSDEESEKNLINCLPVSHEVNLEHGTRPVSALAIDPSGSRLATGGYDYGVKIWDFNGMDASIRPCRDLEPCGSHQIQSLAYSLSGDCLLVCSGSANPVLLDRDGVTLFECVKGDQYLADMAKTKGHTAAVTCGIWHPRKYGCFLTSSLDGTVRLWDVEGNGKTQDSLVKCRGVGGRRSSPSVLAFHPDGRCFVAGCTNGGILCWDPKRLVVNSAVNHTAHTDEIIGAKFSYDGNTLATRSLDGSLKIWDIRQLRRNVNSIQGLNSLYPKTDVIFSPNDKLIITGTASIPNNPNGDVVVFSRESLTELNRISLDDIGVVRLLWHHRLNQLCIGLSNGQCRILFDPMKSHKGALLFVGKHRAKPRVPNGVMSHDVYTPLSLPLYRSGRRKMPHQQQTVDRRDPMKSKKPDPPQEIAKGGRSANSGLSLGSYVSRQLALQMTVPDDSDPRGAILRHKEAAETEPLFISHAYTETQPQPVFAEPEADADEGMSESFIMAKKIKTDK